VSVGSRAGPAEDGIVASAGETHLACEEGAYPPHDFAEPRARVKMLASDLAGDAPSTHAFEELQRSPREAVVEELVPLLQRAAASGRDPASERAASVLSTWNGRRRDESPAAVLAYTTAIHHLLPELFPESRFGGLQRHARLAKGALVRIVSAESSPWFATAEERDASLVRALGAALDTLARELGDDSSGWTWDRLRPESSAPEASAATGPAPVPTTLETIPPTEVVASPPEPEPAARPALGPKRVPAFRMVVDLATRQARLLLAGGQSGRPENPHFKDQLAAWREGSSLELELGETKEGDTVELMPG
jgi:acyl-homoserine lactone acylase PvdQ